MKIQEGRTYRTVPPLGIESSLRTVLKLDEPDKGQLTYKKVENGRIGTISIKRFAELVESLPDESAAYGNDCPNGRCDL